MNRPRKRRGPRGKFADRLREARAVMGMTQQDLSDKLEVHQVTVARWESGAAKPQGLALRYVNNWIAQALGETPRD